MANSTVSFLASGDREYIAKLNQLVADVNQLASLLGLTADLPMGGFKITGLGDPVDSTDGVNLQTANSLLALGATPANIGVTSLGVGTLADGDLLQRDGASLTGLTPPGALNSAVTMFAYQNLGGF